MTGGGAESTPEEGGGPVPRCLHAGALSEPAGGAGSTLEEGGGPAARLHAGALSEPAKASKA